MNRLHQHHPLIKIIKWTFRLQRIMYDTCLDNFVLHYTLFTQGTVITTVYIYNTRFLIHIFLTRSYFCEMLLYKSVFISDICVIIAWCRSGWERTIRGIFRRLWATGPRITHCKHNTEYPVCQVKFFFYMFLSQFNQLLKIHLLIV
jgi:hypothetical protein